MMRVQGVTAARAGGRGDAGCFEPENRSGVAILVAAPTAPVRAVHINETLPEDVLARIDAFAEANGYSRSGFLAYAAGKAMAA